MGKQSDSGRYGRLLQKLHVARMTVQIYWGSAPSSPPTSSARALTDLPGAPAPGASMLTPFNEIKLHLT